MSYVTDDDIRVRMGEAAYVQLTDDAGSGAADAAVIDEARCGAEGEVDSYLALRYAVPVDTAAQPETAAVLRTVTLDLVEYRLHARRPPVPPAVAEKRDAAVRWLQRVAAGQADLPFSPQPGFRAAATGSARVLSRDSLREY